MKTKNNDEANELRWKPGTPGHYEVYYITFNHLESKTGYWIRYTMTAPDAGKGDPCAQLWFFTFDAESPDRNFGITRRFPIDLLETTAYPFSIDIGGNRLENGALSGSLEGAGHSAKWDLKFDPSPVPFLHYPKILYKVQVTDTTVLSPHLDTRFTGTVEADGRKFKFDGDPGDQTHLWGSEHALRWQWAHCNHYAEDDEAVFEAVCAQVKRGPITLPPLHLVYLKLRDRESRGDRESSGDREFHLNNPLDIIMSRSKASPGSWDIRAANLTTRLDIEITCRTADLIDAEYFDPSGEPAYCANTEVASSLVKVYTRPAPLAKWRKISTLTSTGTTHVEWGDRKPHAQAGKKLIVLND